jgi:hypothetical protein
MTTKTKHFDPCVLASITTGVLLVYPFSRVHEAIEHVLGRPIWTHQIPAVTAAASAEVLRQYPDMPTVSEDNWKELARMVTEKYGASVPLEAAIVPKGVKP